MPHFTRRTLLHQTGLVASASAISSILPNQADAENDSSGFFHVFLFRWKPNASEAMKQKAAKDIAAFEGQVPGLLETHVGQNSSPHAFGYTFGGIMRFQDRSAFEAYQHHPLHQALLKWLVPLIDPVELDIPA